MTKAFHYTDVVNVCNKKHSIQDSGALELAKPIKIQGQLIVRESCGAEEGRHSPTSTIRTPHAGLVVIHHAK
jgi:hypothetical protein